MWRCSGGESAAIRVLQALWMICTRVRCSGEPDVAVECCGPGIGLCRHCAEGTRDAPPLIGIGCAHRQVYYDTSYR